MGKGSINISVSGDIGYSLKGDIGYAMKDFSGYSLKSSSGYSSSAGASYKIGSGGMRGYSLESRLHPVTLFPVPYGRIPDPLSEARRLYKKKCPHCGQESMGSGCGYSLN